MKKIALSIIIVLFFNTVYSQIEKSFYFNDDHPFNDNLPFPGDISGHAFGEWHFSHVQLVHYLKKLSSKSNRVSMWEYGRTHENRPLYLLAITSGENQKNLETIRKKHLQSLHSDNKKGELPLVLWLGYSVHGNESSPGNASMLVAYYLAASQSQKVERILDSAVVLIDPCLNPDGFTRAANWSNMHAHETIVTDPADRQFREDWPGGRTNHYWFDLNRDWLPAQHPESQSRLRAFHRWKPHVTTDHHEMGSNSTFFFQPGVPERMNPHTPEENFTLTKEISRFHAEALDDIGSLYFSEEGFDDFYYGKGSTYPDVNASIGILFEQSRVLGQVIENPHGKLSFSEAIRNHFTVSKSTLKAALNKKKKLVSYQENFYQNAIELAKEDEVSGYVFGDQDDPVKLHYFLKMLDYHEIKIYGLNEDISLDGKFFKKGSAYIVPTAQPQYRFIKSLFEQQTEYEDSIFYDVSTWTMPLAFDIDYSVMDDESELHRYKGVLQENISRPVGDIIGSKSEIGYIADGANYNIHSLLYRIKQKGLIAKVSGDSFIARFEDKDRKFSNGSIFIPAVNQDMNSRQIYSYLKPQAERLGIDLYSLNTGLSKKGIDMGSWNFRPVKTPKVLVVAGAGVSSRSAGEIWHLLDHRMNIPVVMVKPHRFERLNLFEYNTIIMPDGHYDWDSRTTNKLGLWLQEGGVIVALEDANRWLDEKDWIAWKKKETMDNVPEKTLPYSSRGDRRRVGSVSGVILKASIDKTHPLSYGVQDKYLPVFKDNNLFIEKSDNPYATPVLINNDPLMSGYLSSKNLENVENTAWCIVNRKGRGQIISFVDNPAFRGYWYGTNKIFMNAIFYGDLIR